ncbi:hypothetical protein M3Y99_00904600 [Aphelenchoides fujianensis]|nr:hypothetical protein M3Y99_00904600 [Aphelenchoides fujianensis]
MPRKKKPAAGRVLALPDSSADLPLEGGCLIDALEIHEFCRCFHPLLQLSPFRFEDFCAALKAPENSRLLGEIHIQLLRFLLHDEEKRETTFEPPDAGVFFALLGHLLDGMNYAEVLRLYVTSDQDGELEAGEVAEILSKPAYPFVTAEKRLLVLKWMIERVILTDDFKRYVDDDKEFNSDENECRTCGKSGEMLICDCCEAPHHLRCAHLAEVPEEEWLCAVCTRHAQQSRSDWRRLATADGRRLKRNEALGVDRFGRLYWFAANRIFVHDADLGTVHYYSTLPQFYALAVQLDAAHFERELCERLAARVDEIAAAMRATVEAALEEHAARQKGERPKLEFEDLTYFEMDNFCRFPEIFDEIRENSAAKISDFLRDLRRHLGFEKGRLTSVFWTGGVDEADLLSSATRAENDLRAVEFHKHLDSAFRSGVSNHSFRSYANLFADEPTAKPWVQRQLEADERRWAAETFGWAKETPVKWTPEKGMHGGKAEIAHVICDSIRQFLLAIPDELKHRLWNENRVKFFEKLKGVTNAQQLVEMLVLAERIVRPCVFQRAWSKSLGALRLFRQPVEQRTGGFAHHEKKKAGIVGWAWVSASHRRRFERAEWPTATTVRNGTQITKDTPAPIRKAANLERLARKFTAWREADEQYQQENLNEKKKKTGGIVHAFNPDVPHQTEPSFSYGGIRKNLKGEGLPFAFPRSAGFRTGTNGRPDFFSVPRESLRRLARAWDRRKDRPPLPGFSLPSKERPAVWGFPSERPQLDHCWRFTALASRSLHAIALYFGILRSFVRWDALRPPATWNVLDVANRKITAHKEIAPGGFFERYKIDYERATTRHDYAEVEEEDEGVGLEDRRVEVGVVESGRSKRKVHSQPTLRQRHPRAAKASTKPDVKWVDGSDLEPHEVADYWRRVHHAALNTKVERQAGGKRLLVPSSHADYSPFKRPHLPNSQPLGPYAEVKPTVRRNPNEFAPPPPLFSPLRPQPPAQPILPHVLLAQVIKGFAPAPR